MKNGTKNDIRNLSLIFTMCIVFGFFLLIDGGAVDKVNTSPIDEKNIEENPQTQEALHENNFSEIREGPEEAKIVLESLKPEIKNRIPKTTININLSENILKLTLESDDLSSLRAAINSYLRWINTALNVKKSV